MLNRLNYLNIALMGTALVALTACQTPTISPRKENSFVPENFQQTSDSENSAAMNWRDYFKDGNLIALIDTALENNQELNIVLQEVEISRNEIQAKTGEYLPSVSVQGGVGADKVGRYTRNGALEATTDIKPGKEFPEPLGDYNIGLYATWEVDVWKKLRNAKKAAVMRYLATVEGKNFMVTHLIAEIANSYYELLTLDAQLRILQENIDIQKKALTVVKSQKDSSRVTELAVKRFEAEVFKTSSIQFELQQKIVETENKINYLVGRFPQPIERSSNAIDHFLPATIHTGIPSQLLSNRPDIKQAELELAASKLDIKVAKARFYPSFGITAGIGFEAFDASYLTETPESLAYMLAGDIAAPLINRKAIKAAYKNANAQQIQAVIQYEQTILNAYIEVLNQLTNIKNLESNYDLKSKQVDALTESISISNNLFQSARADYMEVLLTQRDALESKFDLTETRLQQMSALINIYKSLGGGWQNTAGTETPAR